MKTHQATKAVSTFTVAFILHLAIVIDCTRAASLLDQLNFYASQTTFTSPVFPTPFALEHVMAPSLELALQSCHDSFRWQRWNCPASDFYMRRSSHPLQWDSEDAYVTAINTAAILYTITKNCSSGAISDCGCQLSTSSSSGRCADVPQQAERLYEKHMRLEFKRDFYGSAQRHNYRAVTQLLRKSLVHECGCHSATPGGECLDEPQCRDVLRPFAEIAADVRRMYDEGLQVGSGARENSKVLWRNVPLDALVFMRDAPNYCEPEAVPLWHGMQGRQCSYGAGDDANVGLADGGDQDVEEQNSCEHLCGGCGLSVRRQNVMVERACNCQFTPWTLQVQCDRCVSVEHTYHCY